MKILFWIFSNCKPVKTSQNALVYYLFYLPVGHLLISKWPKNGSEVWHFVFLIVFLPLQHSLISIYLISPLQFSPKWMIYRNILIITRPHALHFFRMAERWNAWHAVWSVAKCILYFKQTVPWKLWYVCPWRKTVHVFHLHGERKRNSGC